MASFIIRKTDRPEDMRRFLELFEANDEESIHPRLVVDDGEFDLWLAESEGELAGGAVMREQPDDNGAIRGFEDNLIVDRRFRRQGLARQLMELAESYYRDRGLVGMQAGGTDGDEPALALFDSLGYRIVRRYTRPERVTAYGAQPSLRRVRMWKDF